MKNKISTKPNEEEKKKHCQSNKANHTISENQKRELENFFFMDGISSYQAAKIVGISPQTAKSYFEIWADELTDDEGHETWIKRNTRVRARLLEGVSKQIISINKRLDCLNRIFYDLILKQDPKNRKNLIQKPVDKIDHHSVQIYEKAIRMTENSLIDLKDGCAKIEITASPSEVIDKEIEKHMRKRMEEKKYQVLSN